MGEITTGLVEIALALGVAVVSIRHKTRNQVRAVFRRVRQANVTMTMMTRQRPRQQESGDGQVTQRF